MGIIRLSKSSLGRAYKIHMTLYQLMFYIRVLLACAIDVSRISDTVQLLANAFHSFIWMLQLWVQQFRETKLALHVHSSAFFVQGFQLLVGTGYSVVHIKAGADNIACGRLYSFGPTLARC